MNTSTTINGWKLPASGTDWLRWFLAAAGLGLFYYMFWGQTVETHFASRLNGYQWLTGHWRGVSNYSHGPLIPAVAGLLVWLRRRELVAVVDWVPARGGVGLVVAAMLVYYAGVKAVQPRVVVLAFVMLLYGLVLALAGRGAMRILFFPITFLLLMIPLNFLDGMVGLPLQMLMAKLSTAALNWLGIEATRQGAMVFSEVYNFDVAAPCSGIRSLMALTTVTAAYGYLTQHAQWKRWILFLSAVPLAVLGNICRVLAVALVGQVYGKHAAAVVHDYAGFIVYGVAIVVMVALGLVLDARIWQWLRNLTKPLTAPVAGNSPLIHEVTHE